jgi:hypothetical protein
MMSVEIAEALSELDIMGLGPIATFIRGMQTAPYTDENIASYSALISLGGITGYTRGYAPTSYLNQLDVEFPVGPNPMASYITDLVKQAMVEGGRAGRIYTFEEWVANFPNEVTSRSSGGARVQFKVTVPVGDSERTFIVNSTSKRMVMWNLGLWLATKAAIFAPNSPEDPGTVGGREVPDGKDPRLIWLIKLAQHLARVEWSVVLEWWMKHHSEFTAGHLTGFFMLDHASALAATSDPFVVPVGNDYSTYDGSIQQWNAKEPFRLGLIGALEELGIADQPFGPEMTYREFIDGMHGPGIGYDTTYVIKDEDEMHLVTVDLINSGRRDTALVDSIVNEANILSYVAEVLSNNRKLRLEHHEVMGDDSIMFVRVARDYNVQDARTLSIGFAEHSKKNGLIVNPKKTLCARYHSEFLKNTFIAGRLAPLWLVQALGAERGEANQPPFAQVRSYASKLTTIARRGGDELVLRRLLYITWRLKSGVKQRSDDRSVRWYYSPFARIHAPMTIGGMGVHPSSLFGASKDGVIVYDLAEKWPHYIPIIERAAGVASADMTNIRRTVTQKIASGDVEPKGVFTRGRELFNTIMVKERLAAERQYRGKFPDLVDLRYSNMPELSLKKAVMDDPSMRKLELKDQQFFGGKLYRAEVEGKTVPYNKGLEWIGQFKLIDNGPLPATHLYNVIPALGDKEKRALHVFGGRGSPNQAMLSAAKLLAPLRADKFGRRDIADEELMRILTKPGSTPETNAQALVYMGFSQDAAVKTATIVHQQASRQALSDNSAPFSGNDGFMQMFDNSLEALEDRFPNDPTGDRTVDGALLQIAQMRSFYDGYASGDFRSYRIELSEGSIGAIMKELTNRAPYTQSMHLTNIYPNRLWSDKTVV